MDIGDDDLQLKQLRQVQPLAGLTVGELWLKYFAIGGSAGQFEIEAYLYAAHALPTLERDLVAHSINERFIDLGMDLRVPYSADLDPGKEES
ncbi:hypothetical protein DQ353_06790 [Arthrobacter sp. AQ5-05]|uniref:hypothetical protein n=1 Tax=Arthrobacter sp. AQ5-05 TaxID=2184581 RepID=UPI000DCE2951|nr:hypothetical protein [Arthrobacter sp. AQ5-05]RAX49867.1 hypothetical protein DQ353_06790 [Arthrobacter sp. AQ5-05]